MRAPPNNVAQPGALVSRGPGPAAQPGRNRGTVRPRFHADRRELAGRRSGMVLRPRQICNLVLEDEAPRRLGQEQADS